MAYNSSLVLSALTTYVDQLEFNRIMTEITLQGRTAKLVQSQRGIKNARTINTMVSNLIVQPAGCGLISPTGSVTLNQQTLTVCPLMVQEAICLNGAGSLEQYWTGMSMPNGSYYDSLTPEIFAREYISDKINKLQDINEFLVWQGDSSGATYSGSLPTQPNNYAINQTQCNGFLHILENTSASQSVIWYSGTASGNLVINTANTITFNSAFSVIDQLAAQQMTSLSNLSNREDLMIFLNYANYRAYMFSLRNLNFFHPYGNALENDNNVSWSFMHPGTNIRLVATSGLISSPYMVLTYAENLYIGADNEGEEDKMEVWKSQDYNSIFLRSLWKLGVIIGYPQYCIVYNGKGIAGGA